MPGKILLKKIIISVLLVLLTTVGVFYTRFIKAPTGIDVPILVRIDEGEALFQIARKFEERNIVRSGQWLSNTVILFEGEKSVIAGDYLFSSPTAVWKVAKRITSGDFGLEPIRVTIREGLMYTEVADIFSEALPRFNKDRFLALAQSKEGYLFPNTYFFLPTADERQVISRMETQFNYEISKINDDIVEFGRPLNEVMVMASIIEGEGVTTTDRRIISGILWKRIRIGMPLQVDTTFLVINGKKTFELTLEDLAIDSPYNTYLYRGLPPAPISSPGLDSILAAVTPIETEYFYYLSEDDGTMHYGRTLDEHNYFKNKYLR